MDDRVSMTEDEHLGEGTIHAWLDGQLAGDAAAQAESHVRYCRECQARVEEARTLIAEASRVVTSLDDPARPFGASGEDDLAAARVRAGSSSVWRWARFTPGRAALAASLLVALGITMTHRRVAHLVISGGGPTTASTSKPANAEDHLLDSAMARRVAESQPPRTMEAASEPAMPVAPAPLAAGQVAQPNAGSQVALGRIEARAVREAAAVSADQSRAGAAGVVGSSAVTPSNVATANPAAGQLYSAKRAMSATARRTADEATPSSATPPPNSAALASAAPQECYMVEAARGGNGTWGPLALPTVVAVQAPTSGGSGTRSARAVQGADTTMLLWVPGVRDSVQIVSAARTAAGDASFGAMVLGAGTDRRVGVIRPAPAGAAGAVSGAAASSKQRVRAQTAQVDIVARRVVCPAS